MRRHERREARPGRRFQSTHSLRSATKIKHTPATVTRVSIHALLAECDRKKEAPGDFLHPVSIHALLAECDYLGSLYEKDWHGFNPRTPCGVRLFTCGASPGYSQFQSTHSLRSATFQEHHIPDDDAVSIHALLAECDENVIGPHARGNRFNPRTPCGVRLINRTEDKSSCQVSIHALLAECDRQLVPGLLSITCFNPRTPCGVRQECKKAGRSRKRFQSTHSLRSATPVFGHLDAVGEVSIHALLAECDRPWRPRRPRRSRFNPRTPCGVRPIKK